MCGPPSTPGTGRWTNCALVALNQGGWGSYPSPNPSTVSATSSADPSWLRAMPPPPTPILRRQRDHAGRAGWSGCLRPILLRRSSFRWRPWVAHAVRRSDSQPSSTSGRFWNKARRTTAHRFDRVLFVELGPPQLVILVTTPLGTVSVTTVTERAPVVRVRGVVKVVPTPIPDIVRPLPDDRGVWYAAPGRPTRALSENLVAHLSTVDSRARGHLGPRVSRSPEFRELIAQAGRQKPTWRADTDRPLVRRHRVSKPSSLDTFQRMLRTILAAIATTIPPGPVQENSHRAGGQSREEQPCIFRSRCFRACRCRRRALSGGHANTRAPPTGPVPAATDTTNPEIIIERGARPISVRQERSLLPGQTDFPSHSRAALAWEYSRIGATKLSDFHDTEGPELVKPLARL